MKAKSHFIFRAAGIALSMLAGMAVAADPLSEAAAAKAAAAKAATEEAAAADTAAREAIAARAEAALAVSDASAGLSAAKKALEAADPAAKATAEKAVADADVRLAAARKAEAEREAASKDAAEKHTALRRVSYPVIAEKAAAEKALAERVAAERAAAAKSAAEKSAAAAVALKKAEGEKTAADKSCRDLIARAEADGKALAGKTGEAKTAAEKAAAESDARANAARKALAEREAALKAAVEAAAAAKVAAEKAAAARTAADKDLSAKTSADKIAAETVRASNLYVALKAVDEAIKEKAAAAKALASTASSESKAKSAHAAAKSVADKAAAEKTAAEKALAAAPGKDKAAAGKAIQAKAAAHKAAADKAAAAKTAADKAAAAARAARDAVAEKARAVIAAQDVEAAARATALGGLQPMPSSEWTHAKARHLMVRAGFGGTPAEVQELYEMGLHDAVNHFVEIYDQPVANIEFDPARLKRPEPWESRLDPVELQDMTIRYRDPERRQQAEMRRWWLRRMAESPRPLQEKLTLFWHDHFAVQYQKRNRTYMLFQQNQLFRTYGADNFEALLRGIVHDPAMISYLDNNVNYKGSGNENLGREILELFSMGEGRGYTEEDLREASRALTGYTFDSWTEQFRFLAARHDEGPKKILGSIGNWGGDDLVDIILRQPATAGYITGKLFEFLAYEAPAEETIEKLAHVMRACSYDLRPVLKNLFLSGEFYSEKAMGTHIKGPVELTIGAIRDLGIQESVNYANVDAAVNQMGQYLFEPPNVAGWNENRTWINAERILVRYNQLAGLVEQPNVDVVALLEGGKLDTPEKVVEQLAKACLVVLPDAAKSRALADYLGELPPATEWDARRDQVNAKLREILVLLMSTPESQLG